MQALTPPAGWEITEKAGSSKVSLTRDYGEEVVQVDFTAREYVSQAPTVCTTPCITCTTPCWARCRQYLSLLSRALMTGSHWTRYASSLPVSSGPACVPRPHTRLHLQSTTLHMPVQSTEAFDNEDEEEDADEDAIEDEDEEPLPRQHDAGGLRCQGRL